MATKEKDDEDIVYVPTIESEVETTLQKLVNFLLNENG